jgi:3-methyladenine DNA glycosylase/8-oxoguanine DNA glycosylase
MPKNWVLKSIAPHDFYLCLDIDSYWDFEHNPESIYEQGFNRPLNLADGNSVIVNIQFNGEVEAPSFAITCNESLTNEQITEANVQLARVLGTNLDLRPLYEHAASDPILGPYLNEYYGLKRISRASLFEETINRIVQMNLSHKPTARKMMYKVREKYGNAIMTSEGTVAAWPRPDQLKDATPEHIRACGPTVRKGEYIIRMAEQIVEGSLDINWLDTKADPTTFVNSMIKIKGIGPSAAQQLVLTRDRTDGAFPSTKKSGEEQGLRKWILLTYGVDANTATEEDFLELTKSWRNYESVAIEFLYLNWINSYKSRKNQKSTS